MKPFIQISSVLNLFRPTVLLCICFLLTSCAYTPYYLKQKGGQGEATPDPSAAKLAEAASSVSHSLQRLAEIEIATHPDAKLPPPPNPSQIGMDQLISVDWTGPVEPLLARIGKLSRYRVRVLGIQPAIPAIISVSEQDTLLADVLRNIELQMKHKGRIKLYPKSRVIELRYSQS
jgi:defect in organelle trafficking protein DotD